MWKLSVSIPAALILFTAGLSIMIIPINDALSIQWNVITYALWGIAMVWLVSMIIYRQQRVTLDIRLQELSPKSEDEFIMRIEGFIHSRHPDGLRDIKLWLHPSLGFNSIRGVSSVPHSIDSKPQMFRVSYSVTYQFAKQAMEEQQTDGRNVAWVLSADMRNAEWLCLGGIIAPSMLKEGLTRMAGEHEGTEGTRNGKKRKLGQLGISKGQFHKLLNKTTQPIKKSDSEKSGT